MIDKNIIISNRLEKKLAKSVAEVEKEIFTLLQKLLSEFETKNGHFVPAERTTELLATINKEIRKILETTNLKTEFTEFIDDFDLINENIRAIQKDVNGIRLSKDIFTDAKKFQIDYTVNSLRQANIDLRFIAPIKQLLYSRVAFGAGVLQTEKQLRQIIVGKDGNGVLQRWVGQVARDTINQYQGVVNSRIKVKYDFNAVRYIGSLVEDSRWQCVRWVEMETLKDSELAAEIALAFKKGSGMIPGTDIENFNVNRGGYNCRHHTIPTRV